MTLTGCCVRAAAFVSFVSFLAFPRYALRQQRLGVLVKIRDLKATLRAAHAESEAFESEIDSARSQGLQIARSVVRDQNR